MRSATRRQWLVMALGGAAGWALRRRDESLQRVVHTHRALGTEVAITALHERRAAADDAVRAAFEELNRVEDVMSLYRPGSDLCRLNRHGVLHDPHPYLVEVLRRAAAMSAASDGAFDATVQPLWRLFADAKKAGELPTAEAIDAARRLVNWRRVEVTRQRIRLHVPGMAVTLNGIAQGFAADRVTAALKAHGIRHALIDTGELGAIGDREGSESWKVGVQHPRRADAYAALAALKDRCMATSGDYATRFDEEGRLNHVFDPRTGVSPAELASVSVVAPTAIEADALSTALMVTGPREGMALIRSTPGAEALFVGRDGSVTHTAGFPRIAEGAAS